MGLTSKSEGEISLQFPLQICSSLMMPMVVAVLGMLVSSRTNGRREFSFRSKPDCLGDRYT
jgi:hypothetical protein